MFLSSFYGMKMLLFGILFTFSGVALGYEERITNSSGFSKFVNSVNSGTNYYGTTVFLDSDLSLPEITDTIGKDTSKYFRGVFDGQGHIINDLKIHSQSVYTGVFGWSDGLIIKNIVLSLLVQYQIPTVVLIMFMLEVLLDSVQQLTVLLSLIIS